MPTIYDLKPRFQALLRPLASRLVAAGVTANHVTLAAAAMSVAAGALVAANIARPAIFWLIPPVYLLRMALNAIDGMMAREFGQASKLGAYLNEITDVVSDLALILPFALIPAFGAAAVVAFAFFAMFTEFAGVLAQAIDATRRYDGPFGKSDRAAALSIVAAWIGSGFPLAGWSAWVFPVLAALSLLTVSNRIRAGLRAK